ncbi:HP0268 family nuclease [uncultured Campylobacter sp.]|uniref:HP0268 family nuclease n=1 Tax=uncultured Campylobacter sp. TaxID=218934 RepID=UPI00261A4E0E|nr:HP0268 family nuclease [uncultured Campylobacter sp.]
MQLKLARTELASKPKSVKIEDLQAQVEKSGQKIFYLDRENSQKDLVALVDFFDTKGFSVYQRIVRYGLNENEYMYEVHIL